jgi:hypothetical protein
MDWLANLGLKESDIDFTSSEYCPQALKLKINLNQTKMILITPV